MAISALVQADPVLDKMSRGEAMKLSPWPAASGKGDQGAAMLTWLRSCRSQLSPLLAELAQEVLLEDEDPVGLLQRFQRASSAVSAVAESFRAQALVVTEADKAVGQAVERRLEALERGQEALAAVRSAVREILHDMGGRTGALVDANARAEARADASMAAVAATVAAATEKMTNLYEKWAEEEGEGGRKVRMQVAAEAKIASLEQAVPPLEAACKEARAEEEERRNEEEALRVAAAESTEKFEKFLTKLEEIQKAVLTSVGNANKLDSWASLADSPSSRAAASAMTAC
jgi:hypothetical protein